MVGSDQRSILIEASSRVVSLIAIFAQFFFSGIWIIGAIAAPGAGGWHPRGVSIIVISIFIGNERKANSGIRIVISQSDRTVKRGIVSNNRAIGGVFNIIAGELDRNIPIAIGIFYCDLIIGDQFIDGSFYNSVDFGADCASQQFSECGVIPIREIFNGLNDLSYFVH